VRVVAVPVDNEISARLLFVKYTTVVNGQYGDADIRPMIVTCLRNISSQYL